MQPGVMQQELPPSRLGLAGRQAGWSSFFWHGIMEGATRPRLKPSTMAVCFVA
mgnify:CR=1 FL=1